MNTRARTQPPVQMYITYFKNPNPFLQREYAELIMNMFILIRYTTKIRQRHFNQIFKQLNRQTPRCKQLGYIVTYLDILK